MRLAGTIFFTVAVCAWSTVMFAWVDQRQRVAREELDTFRGWIVEELDAIRARMDEELDRLWGHVHEDDADDEPADLDDLAWQDHPATQPITLPPPAGPATEPADQVLIAHWAEDVPHPVDSDDRKALQAAWVDETLARFDFSGRAR